MYALGDMTSVPEKIFFLGVRYFDEARLCDIFEAEAFNPMFKLDVCKLLRCYFWLFLVSMSLRYCFLSFPA